MILKPFFCFGSRSSKELGLSIESKQIYTGGTAEIDELLLPGRDGSYLDHKNRRNNTEVVYETYLKAERPEELLRMTTEVNRWLLSQPGQYRRLEDTYDPDHYRKAAITESLEIEQVTKRFARQSVVFTCLPYRYRKSGEHPISFDKTIVLQNDTGFPALPALEIEVTASQYSFVTVRIDYDLADGASPYAQTWETKTGGTLLLDSEAQEARLTSGAVLYLQAERFPTLRPGENTITVSGSGITGCQITPHWREL